MTQQIPTTVETARTVKREEFGAPASDPHRFAFNNGWWFTPTWADELRDAKAALTTPERWGLVAARLPHTVREHPIDSFSEREYQVVSGYLRAFTLAPEHEGKTVRLVLDGVAQHTTLFCNGQLVGTHACGYTAAQYDLTQHLDWGAENVISVRVDARAELDQPPFGGVVDYMTFGGIYREAWLDVRNPQHLETLQVSADGDGSLVVKATLSAKSDDENLVVVSLRMLDGSEIARASAPVVGVQAIVELVAKEAQRWSPASPTLHEVSVRLVQGDTVIDERRKRIGFRTVHWDGQGLRINSETVALRGLNRHQSWPYLGYAAPARAQRLDADILHRELACTVVRTSHYPQSHHFLDRCDELGLLVVTEIPGWQHIGGDTWKRQAVENTSDMVSQWHHHPSIIAWGVRINESADDDELYAETNAVARALDPTRPTTGVRNFAGSNLLEDVYAFNDFSHTGENAGVKAKGTVTPELNAGYFVSEHTGHMFPTKAEDDEAHRVAHALRHARVTSDAAAQPGVAGAIGWSMFDYATQRDFGSGDRICHHGVLDLFRGPKLAAALYASQGDADRFGPVLVPASAMHGGDHAGGNFGDTIVFTNADAVRLFRDDTFVAAFEPSPLFPGLAHPPVVIDDLIGDQLAADPEVPKVLRNDIKATLMDVARYGLEALPAPSRDRLQALLESEDFSMELGTRLFTRYLGAWGDRAAAWRFEAVLDGNTVARVTRGPAEQLRLIADADTQHLVDAQTWDLATIRLRLVDEHGATQHYARRTVHLELDGDAELVGPHDVPLAGGAAGTYVRTIGRGGTATLRATVAGAEPVEISFVLEHPVLDSAVEARRGINAPEGTYS